MLLCGENGAGKSTLLRILAGMERPDYGMVTIEGLTQGWRKARRRLLADSIYLHQTPYLFEGSIRHNLNYPLRGTRAIRDLQVREGLEWSGLSAIADQPVHQLSGGERQRVALARAWLRRPRVMLLDEPTTNMDQACRQRTIELLYALKQEDMALVVASHDPAHFSGVADDTLELSGGELNKARPAYVGLSDKVTAIDCRIRAIA